MNIVIVAILLELKSVNFKTERLQDCVFGCCILELESDVSYNGQMERFLEMDNVLVCSESIVE